MRALRVPRRLVERSPIATGLFWIFKAIGWDDHVRPRVPALSITWPVHIRSVGNTQDRYLGNLLIDLVDDPKRPAARTERPGELSAQWLTYPTTSFGKITEGKFYNCRHNTRGRPLHVSARRRRENYGIHHID